MRWRRRPEARRPASAALERCLVDLASANDQLVLASRSFARSLALALDARDRYTAAHCAAVAIYTPDIAARIGLGSEQQEIAYLCGLVHDIGTIGLPAGLLEKPGALTFAEQRIMETHSVIGERILSEVADYGAVARVVRHHHERWDGQGYPDRLRREEIPCISRIIAVAEAYSAMTSDRPYRDAMPSRVARLQLAHAAESQFDPGCGRCIEAILEDAAEDYRSGTRSDFELRPTSSGDRPQVSVSVSSNSCD